MRIPVLLSIPTQAPLVAAANAFFARRERDRGIEKAILPGPVRLDPSFPPIPLGRGEGRSSIESLRPDNSKRFAVRATIEVESLQAVPPYLDDAQVFADPLIEPFQHRPITCIMSPPQGTYVDVQAALDTAGLAAKGLDGDGVAIAIVDSGINKAHLDAKLGFSSNLDVANSWSPPGAASTPGAWPVGHGTMCAFDALIAAPRATLIDVQVHFSGPGGAAISSDVGDAMLAHMFLLAQWGVIYAAAGVSKYKALVVSNSWGLHNTFFDFPPWHSGRYSDNPRHPFHKFMTLFVNAGIDVLFAAGNCGRECPHPRCGGVTSGTIMGCNAHADVLSVAGCDFRNDRVGYSARGPSIVGMPPQKPDITGYTHFLGSEAMGPGEPDLGTSAACPVVAGCIAAIRTRLPHTTTPPASLFAQVMATAAAGPGTAPGSWNADYGHGIIDPVAAATALGL
jgi:subtilisin family serine protease